MLGGHDVKEKSSHVGYQTARFTSKPWECIQRRVGVIEGLSELESGRKFDVNSDSFACTYSIELIQSIYAEWLHQSNPAREESERKHSLFRAIQQTQSSRTKLIIPSVTFRGEGHSGESAQTSSSVETAGAWMKCQILQGLLGLHTVVIQQLKLDYIRQNSGGDKPPSHHTVQYIAGSNAVSTMTIESWKLAESLASKILGAFATWKDWMNNMITNSAELSNDSSNAKTVSMLVMKGATEVLHLMSNHSQIWEHPDMGCASYVGCITRVLANMDVADLSSGPTRAGMQPPVQDVSANPAVPPTNPAHDNKHDIHGTTRTPEGGAEGARGTTKVSVSVQFV
jgi:hypothetical protein